MLYELNFMEPYYGIEKFPIAIHISVTSAGRVSGKSFRVGSAVFTSSAARFFAVASLFSSVEFYADVSRD